MPSFLVELTTTFEVEAEDEEEASEKAFAEFDAACADGSITMNDYVQEQ